LITRGIKSIGWDRSIENAKSRCCSFATELFRFREIQQIASLEMESSGFSSISKFIAAIALISVLLLILQDVSNKAPVKMIGNFAQCPRCGHSVTVVQNITSEKISTAAKEEKQFDRSEVMRFESGKQFNLAHIPKTSGTSLRYELQQYTNSTFFSKEVSVPSMINGTSAIVLGMLRDPHAHVLSQFMHCKYNPYNHKRNYTGFPRNRTKTQEGDLEDFDEWIEHFQSMERASPQNSWDCYNPVNMLTRFFGPECHPSEDLCRGGKSHRQGSGSLHQAIHNLFVNVEWFAVTELYHESVCLFRWQANGFLPTECNADTAQKAVHRSFGHHIPHYDVKAIPERTIAKIDAITKNDRALYEAGRSILEQRIRSLELLLNVRIFKDKAFSALQKL